MLVLSLVDDSTRSRDNSGLKDEVLIVVRREMMNVVNSSRTGFVV